MLQDILLCLQLQAFLGDPFKLGYWAEQHCMQQASHLTMTAEPNTIVAC